MERDRIRRAGVDLPQQSHCLFTHFKVAHCFETRRLWTGGRCHQHVRPGQHRLVVEIHPARQTRYHSPPLHLHTCSTAQNSDLPVTFEV
eukprot:scaffold88724_cov75-Phaeocystis_antarctica.AAC.5